MKPYVAVLKTRGLLLFQYRAAALAGLGTQLFWGLIRMMIFYAFFESTRAAIPMNLSQTISYIWLGQALLLLLPFRPDQDIVEMIRKGSVAYEMVRPIDLYWTWFARNVAQRVTPVVMRAIPMFIVAGLFFGLQPPVSIPAAIAFLFSVAAAAVLSSAIYVLLNICLFWTITGEGIARTGSILTFFLSGIVVPLPFLPPWLQNVMAVLPFRGIMDIPFRLYIGHLPAKHAPFLIIFQMAWIVAFVLFGRWLIRRSIKKVVIQGG